jgi:hypothetical protein
MTTIEEQDGRKLGKKPGHVEDDRHIRLASLLTVQVPVATWRIATRLTEWPMLGNDELGNCTCASLGGHRIMAQEWSSGQRDVIPITTADVIDFYSRAAGYVPGRPETDQGAYLIDPLKVARRDGIGREADGTRHTIYAYAQVDLPTTYAASIEFRVAARLFGGVYLGLALPRSAQYEGTWKMTADPPYSWGGHAVWLIGYDANGLTCVTWGEEQRMTWDWARRYVDEAWVVITEDFINRLGRTPQGLDRAALALRLAAL